MVMPCLENLESLSFPYAEHWDRIWSLVAPEVSWILHPAHCKPRWTHRPWRVYISWICPFISIDNQQRLEEISSCAFFSMKYLFATPIICQLLIFRNLLLGRIPTVKFAGNAVTSVVEMIGEHVSFSKFNFFFSFSHLDNYQICIFLFQSFFLKDFFFPSWTVVISSVWVALPPVLALL